MNLESTQVFSKIETIVLRLNWCLIGVRLDEVTFKFVQWESLGYLCNSPAK